jgi:Ca2+-binding EF-hand superfamily protein
MTNQLNQTEAKKITIKDLSETLKNLSLTLDNENLEAIECAIYIINKHLNGHINYTERKKMEIRELIDNL